VPDFENGEVALRLILMGSASIHFTDPFSRKSKERPSELETFI
jgi:hypothetical protein